MSRLEGTRPTKQNATGSTVHPDESRRKQASRLLSGIGFLQGGCLVSTHIAERCDFMPLERDALKGWRIPGQAGNVGRLMKGVCHGPFVGEVDNCEAIPR